jgi:hypothetical protein
MQELRCRKRSMVNAWCRGDHTNKYIGMRRVWNLSFRFRGGPSCSPKNAIKSWDVYSYNFKTELLQG